MFLLKYLRWLYSIENPSHAIRMYTLSVENLVRINQEDITQEGWFERWENIQTSYMRRYNALTEDEKHIVNSYVV